MYQIYVDDELFCDSRVDDLAIINPVINLEVNKAGTFSFTIPPQHPFYDAIMRRTSLVRVARDDEDIFEGICISVTDDFYKQRLIECEGCLTFLNDTMQRPHKYKHLTVRQMLETLIANHNALCEAKKHFAVGIVTVQEEDDDISTSTNYISTMEALNKTLVEALGGYLRLRLSDGIRYIDYLQNSPNTASQTIRLGDNLIDFESSLDSTKIATVIIPRGATLEESSIEGLDERVSIASVNDGLDYLVSPEALNTYGWIEKVVEWDNVTVPANLKHKAEKYLTDTQFENMVIEAKAIDLHIADADIEPFKVLDSIRVVSKPHGLDRYFLLAKQTINLNNPESDKITLGIEQAVSLTAQNTKENAEMIKRVEDISVSSILESAKENATQQITNAGNGYITIRYDEHMHPYELLIMDTDNIETAQKVWRWNSNGLGYSSNGYDGEYGLAMTSDGEIVADFITTGEMSADRIYGGTLALGGRDNIAGLEKVYDSNGNEIISIGKDGISIKNEDTNMHNLKISSVSGNTHYETDYYAWGMRIEGQKDDEWIRKAEFQAFLMQMKTEYGQVEILPYQFSMEYDGVLFYMTLLNGEWPDIHAEGGKITIGVVKTINMYASGTKSRIADTDNYGRRLQYCYEMPSPMFGDIGEGKTDEDGISVITIDDIFSETIDTDVEYQVFLQPYGAGSVYVAERTPSYFKVMGEPNLSFGWELKAVQRDYDSTRLETYEEEDNEES